MQKSVIKVGHIYVFPIRGLLMILGGDRSPQMWPSALRAFRMSPSMWLWVPTATRFITWPCAYRQARLFEPPFLDLSPKVLRIWPLGMVPDVAEALLCN